VSEIQAATDERIAAIRSLLGKHSHDEWGDETVLQLCARIEAEKARADRAKALADAAVAENAELRDQRGVFERLANADHSMKVEAEAKAARLEAALRELSYLVGMGNPAAVERQRGLIRNALGEG
jgi:hypothetical protein